jgi:L-ascorbate metabolism protein UlaG (beta-lactamase superfamily)
MKQLIGGWIAALCLLAACRGPAVVTPSATFLPITHTPPATRVPATLTQTAIPASATATPTAAPTVQEASATPTSLPACMTLFYENNAQVEIIAPHGERVLIDVYDPALLSSPATADDILLTTHTHWDHVNDSFLQGFAGQQLFVQTGEMALPWARIRGIASAHNMGDPLKPEGGSNYIYLLELAGLRLAHFGDIGQEAFTEEQLAALQPLDIAIIQIANAYSDMDAVNQKGIRLIEQLAPRLIIPTHANLDTAKIAVGQWPGLVSERAAVRLCQGQLPAETQILFLGEWAQKFPKYLPLQVVEW